jgi:hypothetical protein
MSVTTRLGNAGDFQGIVPMMRQYRLWEQQIDLALYALHPDAESRFRLWVAHMAEDPRSTLVVADEQGRLIGFVLATIERELPIYLYEEFAVVREWWVEPDLPPARRRQGADRARRRRRAPPPRPHHRPRRQRPRPAPTLRLPSRRKRDGEGVADLEVDAWVVTGGTRVACSAQRFRARSTAPAPPSAPC